MQEYETIDDRGNTLKLHETQQLELIEDEITESRS